MCVARSEAIVRVKASVVARPAVTAGVGAAASATICFLPPSHLSKRSSPECFSTALSCLSLYCSVLCHLPVDSRALYFFPCLLPLWLSVHIPLSPGPSSILSSLPYTCCFSSRRLLRSCGLPTLWLQQLPHSNPQLGAQFEQLILGHPGQDQQLSDLVVQGIEGRRWR